MRKKLYLYSVPQYVFNHLFRLEGSLAQKDGLKQVCEKRTGCGVIKPLSEKPIQGYLPADAPWASWNPPSNEPDRLQYCFSLFSQAKAAFCLPLPEWSGQANCYLACTLHMPIMPFQPLKRRSWKGSGSKKFCVNLFHMRKAYSFQYIRIECAALEP